MIERLSLGLMRTSPGEGKSLFAGVRSPPVRGGRAQTGWPDEENPEMTRKAVFSEGRGLRVREYRPDASPRYVIITERQATALWPSGDVPRVKPVPFLPGVRSPPLREVGHPGQDGLAGKGPR